MPFKKGQSGNPNGRPKEGTSWAAVLEKIGGEKIKAGKEEITKKEAVARKLWGEAAKGQPWAINALMDRLDGKPKQVVDQTTRNVSINVDGEDAEAST
jgi:hypothetical protein